MRLEKYSAASKTPYSAVVKINSIGGVCSKIKCIA